MTTPTTTVTQPGATGSRLLNKVPEVTVWFWIIKILCTTVGESFADYINTTLGFGLTNTMLLFTAVFAVVLTWLAVAMGVAARSVESASNTPMVLLLLPFLGSGFVPVDTMPTAVRLFAEHQPFTPVIETVRGLLAGTPLDAATTWTAVGWCVALTVLGWAWTQRSYRRPRP